MATASFVPGSTSVRRIRLADIDALVWARLGPTRGLGNSQPACFNRQVAMYLAGHVGRWSTKIIGRFYEGRDHSTVCYSIRRIAVLRESNPAVDALITDLTAKLCATDQPLTAGSETKRGSLTNLSRRDVETLADLIAERDFELAVGPFDTGADNRRISFPS